jgi:hypothetical protein
LKQQKGAVQTQKEPGYRNKAAYLRAVMRAAGYRLSVLQSNVDEWLDLS